MNKYLDAFLKGVAHLIPFGYTDSEVQRILNQSDREALRSDWQAVGNDMRRAIRQYEKELKG